MRVPIYFGAKYVFSTFTPCTQSPTHKPCPNCRLDAKNEMHNLMTTVGLNLIASVFNWSGVQAQNAALGNPFSAVNLANVAGTNDIYGAVGTNSTAASSGDTTLGTEIARTIISNATLVTNTVTWDFFWGLGGATGTIAELGVFAQANGTPNNGVLLDHAILNPTIVVTASQTALFEAIFQFTSG